MAKNVVIFSDGTGQRSGISFDERRSNIYKLYRATRCGPDTEIDPSEQVTFYDGGVGTAPPGSNALWRTYVSVRNIVGMATGWGLTTNVVDCYAAIIRLWRPGDKIYLFGFSRGAYTVRLLSGVLSHCGIPTHDGSPLKPGEENRPPRDAKAVRKIAKEGVIKVYQHTGSVRLREYKQQLIKKFGKPDKPLTDKVEKLYKLKKERLDQRSILAAAFRDRYQSGMSDQLAQEEMFDAKHDIIPNRGISNAVPYFIGVFDTVSSMWHPRAIGALIAIFIATILSIALAYTLYAGGVWPFPAPVEKIPEGAAQADPGFWLTFARAVKWLLIVTVVPGVAYFLYCHIRFPGELKCDIRDRVYSKWETMTLFTRMVFDDRTLSSRVPCARHAIAVDEQRDLFELVRWEHEDTPGGEAKLAKAEDPNHVRLREMCFAGAHTDIGGGYPEDESRLSDISLNWMAKQAKGVGLQIDNWYFQLWPDALGVQHDESVKWPYSMNKPVERTGLDDVELHPSLEHRIRAGLVPFQGSDQMYRPKSLENNARYASIIAMLETVQAASGLTASDLDPEKHADAKRGGSRKRHQDVG